jgi:hypothetical protein
MVEVRAQTNVPPEHLAMGRRGYLTWVPQEHSQAP